MSRRECLGLVWQLRTSSKNGNRVNQDYVNPDLPVEQTSALGRARRSKRLTAPSAPTTTPKSFDSLEPQKTEIFSNVSSSWGAGTATILIALELYPTSSHKKPVMLAGYFGNESKTKEAQWRTKPPERAPQNHCQDAFQQASPSQADNVSMGFEGPFDVNVNPPPFNLPRTRKKRLSKENDFENSLLNDDDELEKSRESVGCISFGPESTPQRTVTHGKIGPNAVGPHAVSIKASNSTYTTSLQATPSAQTPPSSIPLPSVPMPTFKTWTPTTHTPAPQACDSHVRDTKSHDIKNGDRDTRAKGTEAIENYLSPALLLNIDRHLVKYLGLDQLRRLVSSIVCLMYWSKSIVTNTMRSGLTSTALNLQGLDINSPKIDSYNSKSF